jgi:hypothetical protein
MAVREDKMTRTIGALALAGMLASAPEAVAVGHGPGGTQTFEGRCHFSGELRQRPPLTNAP